MYFVGDGAISATRSWRFESETISDLRKAILQDTVRQSRSRSTARASDRAHRLRLKGERFALGILYTGKLSARTQVLRPRLQRPR